MYHVSAQGVDERMTNVHYYYYPLDFLHARLSLKRQARSQEMFGEGGSGAGGGGGGRWWWLMLYCHHQNNNDDNNNGNDNNNNNNSGHLYSAVSYRQW